MSAIQGMQPITLCVWRWFRSHRFISKICLFVAQRSIACVVLDDPHGLDCHMSAQTKVCIYWWRRARMLAVERELRSLKMNLWITRVWWIFESLWCVESSNHSSVMSLWITLVCWVLESLDCDESLNHSVDDEPLNGSVIVIQERHELNTTYSTK